MDQILQSSTSRREQAKAERRSRIIQAARDLIRETGETDLSMRSLADRAGVSHATPYNLFGSKRAIILSILEDERTFNENFARLPETDSLELIFSALSLATGFYAADPDFYRAVWRALLNGSSKGDTGLASPERLRTSRILWRGLLESAQRDGYITPDADIRILQNTLAASINGVLLTWVTGGMTSTHLVPSGLLGFALILNGAATPKGRKKLAPKITDLQEKLAKAPGKRASQPRRKQGLA